MEEVDFTRENQGGGGGVFTREKRGGSAEESESCLEEQDTTSFLNQPQRSYTRCASNAPSPQNHGAGERRREDRRIMSNSNFAPLGCRLEDDFIEGGLF